MSSLFFPPFFEALEPRWFSLTIRKNNQLEEWHSVFLFSFSLSFSLHFGMFSTPLPPPAPPTSSFLLLCQIKFLLIINKFIPSYRRLYSFASHASSSYTGKLSNYYLQRKYTKPFPSNIRNMTSYEETYACSRASCAQNGFIYTYINFLN